jgi:hypothetical protein
MRFAANGVDIITDESDSQAPANTPAGNRYAPIEVEEAPKGSGLYNMLEDYLGGEPPANTPPSNGEASPAETSPADTPPAETETPKYEEMEKPALLEHIQKSEGQIKEYTGKITELETKLNELKTQHEALKNTTVSDEDTKKFFDELKTDFEGTYNKYRQKFNLPDLGLVRAQITGGGNKARLAQYLESIKPQIEEKFNLEKGSFKFDYNEAMTDPNSASAHYLELKNDYEGKLTSEISAIQQNEKIIAEKAKAQQDADFQFIADTHFGGDLQKVKDVFTEMSQVATNIAAGKEGFGFEKHPFAMRNVIRGFLHDKLIQETKEQTAKEIKAELAKLNIYLPADNLPTALTGIKPESGSGNGDSTSRNTFSPMESSIFGTLESIPHK